MKQILLVDDKASIGKVLSMYLGKEYDFVYCEDPLKAIEWLHEGNEPDLIISDIRMPKMNGSEFLKYLKDNELFKHIPVMMLSSEESTTERIRLLEEGAVDYILKPFNPMELVARVRSQLRRYTSLGDIHTLQTGTRINNGRLTYCPEEHLLLADGDPVHLTATEMKIMDLLMRNIGRFFPAEEIFSRVWGENAYSAENTVMVHIRRIREKIELNPKEPEYIKVVWGIGYKMEKISSGA